MVFQLDIPTACFLGRNKQRQTMRRQAQTQRGDAHVRAQAQGAARAAGTHEFACRSHCMPGPQEKLYL